MRKQQENLYDLKKNKYCTSHKQCKSKLYIYIYIIDIHKYRKY